MICQILKPALYVLLVSALLTNGAAAGEWSVSQDEQSRKCSLTAEKKTIYDGYQTAAVFLIVDDRSVKLRSESVLDPGFSDIGMKVDQKDFIPMDKLEKERVAVFETRREQLIEQFIRGREVEVRLRFWPTWPTTGTHTAKFSLLGFTKAFDQYSKCK